MAFLKGYLFGLSLVIFVGPVFFTLLKSALNYGTWAGLATAGGIILSDIACVILCYTSSIAFFQSTDTQFWIALASALILMSLGIRYIFKPKLDTGEELTFSSFQYVSFFAKGFLVNFVNPFVFLVWLGIITFAKAEYANAYQLGVFLAAVLSGILTTDVLKVLFAQKLKPFIEPHQLTKIYKIIGIVLLVFASRLLWFAFSRI